MSWQAEVRELDYYVREYENVACCDVSVHDLVLALQVVERAAHLLGEHEKCANRQGTAPSV